MVYHPSTPIVIADDDRQYMEASVGASKLLGLPREKLIGSSLDDFAEPGSKALLSQEWRDFLDKGEHEGTLHLVGKDGCPRSIAYTAKRNVLPVRHLVLLRDQGVDPSGNTPEETEKDASASGFPVWVQDYALLLLDVNGRVVAWYSGAERIYGYGSDEIVGQHVSVLYSGEDALLLLKGRLERATSDGHEASEGWHVKKDGSRFWVNDVTMALKNENGDVQGFAKVARDFSDRHERDEELRRSHARLRLLPDGSTIAGIVSGEFDGIRDANDAFLELVGYDREDLLSGRLCWRVLNPPEHSAVDELAHEEGLRFGACTPFEKELIRKDGSRIPVLITTAVVRLSPFQWMTFVQDLRGRERLENIDEALSKVKRDQDEIIGMGTAMKRVVGQLEVIAPSTSAVLILGEAGTGKELIARTLHRMSPRRHFPFVILDCAAVPTGLLESELFGYERGTLTGASSQKIGQLESAHRGTLFLEEVGSISLDLQAKLLRVLQEKSFERLGGTRTIPIDLRLVTSTGQNLPQMVGEKLFRSDLYYWLNVFPITTTPLRDHPEDIPILARHFVKKYAAQMDRKIEIIPSDTMRAMVSWPWPGNVRELDNFIERSVLVSRGSVLRAPVAELGGHAAGTSTLEEVERDYILCVFRDTGGVISTTANRLGVPRTTLNAMMKKLGISRNDL